MAVMVADMLFEIGRGVFGKHQYEDAVRWLERAHNVVGERDLEELDHDFVELRLAILNFLVRAYLRLGDPEAREKASGIVDMLQLESGDKMAVQLLRIDVLAADSELDVEKYHAVVARMIRSIDLTNANFKTIIHHIHKIKGKNAELAAKALDEFLHTRLLTGSNGEWIEKVVVTQIWIHVDSGGSLPSKWLRDLLDVVLQQSHPFEAPATHAAQTILWKRLEIAYSQGKYPETESWCNIALHPLFAKAGETNKAKISRKLILCAVARQDHNAARQVFFEMSESAKNAWHTRYLMYKSAIRDGQSDFAAECLDVICRHSDKDATLLYACVMEALPLEDKRQAILALQKVLEKYEYGAPVGVHLPALLRSTIRLLVPHLGSADEINEPAMEELCKVFEGAAAQATKARRRHHEHEETDLLFTDKEIEWFSRNSYNISLKYCGPAHPSYLLRLLNICIQFIGLLPNAPPKAGGGANASASSDLVLRLLLCHYLASCAAVVLARATGSVPESLAAYATTSKHASSFRNVATPYLRSSITTNPSNNNTTTPGRAPDLGAATRADLAAKRAQLLRYELESALRRSDWDGLDVLWDECFDMQQQHTSIDIGKNSGGRGGGNWYTHHLEALADLALVIHAELAKLDTNSTDSSFLTSPHRARILNVLQRIVNQTWQSGRASSSDADIVHLARWIRCLFHLSISQTTDDANADTDDTTPLQCINQATSVISSIGILGATPIANQNAYPQDEAEWLASKAFNRAIDFYCAGDDARCRLWAERAMGLARAVERGGGPVGLYGVLRERYEGLGVDGGEGG